MDITYGGTFIAGLLSFVSPCVLPLVVPYLTFIAGVTLDDLTDEFSSRDTRIRAFRASIAFVLGLATIFVLLGAGAGLFGRTLRQIEPVIPIFGAEIGLFSLLGGLVIILMGLHFIGLFRIGFLDREARFQVRRKPSGPLGSYIIGVAFAFGWTPCIGPVLGTVLGIAGSRDSAGYGALLLFVYAMGLGLPFVIAALFAGPFMNWMKRFRRHMGTVEKVMGGLLVITGFLFLFGQMTAFSNWLLRTFPGLQSIG
ncbi:MAG: cytochrome c biogenesis CcdA family protein [Bauldia sp.]